MHTSAVEAFVNVIQETALVIQHVPVILEYAHVIQETVQDT